MSKPKTVSLSFKVDPCQGIAQFAVSTAPVGYRFVKMERKGTKATITYQREDERDESR